MNLFLLQKIGEIKIYNEDNFYKKVNKLFNEYEKVNLYGISGVFMSLDKEIFKKKLPLLNGMFGKYYFVDFGISPVKEELILGKNIYSLDFNEDNIKNIQNDIENIQKELRSNKLITRSKKLQYYNILKDSTYYIAVYLIKSYFLINDIISNKKELTKIINDSDSPEDLKGHAMLLKEVGFDKTETLINKFKILSKQLEHFSSIMKEYFNTYINK